MSGVSLSIDAFSAPPAVCTFACFAFDDLSNPPAVSCNELEDVFNSRERTGCGVSWSMTS